MPASVADLKAVWALLALLTAAALLPGGPGLVPILIWLVAMVPGTVVIASEGRASRAAEGMAGAFATGPRLPAFAVVALLTFAALVYGVAAALVLATAVSSALLVLSWRHGSGGARRLLEQVAAFGTALVLVLVPLEFLLRIPAVAAQFGLPNERRRVEADYDRLWEHNVFGFRSRYERVSRRPGVPRIIALGDSFTWGLLLASADSAWPAWLERDLRAATDSAVEVINMGQRGWATANEAEFLRRLGWQFDPDLVLVQYFLNDAYESAPDFHFREGRRVLLLPEAFAQGYIRSSSLAALVTRGVNGLLFGVLFPERESADLYADDAQGWRQAQRALREMGDSARARRTPIMLVLFPALLPGEWTPATYPAREIYARVRSEAERSGLLTLDLTEAFSREGGDWSRWWATPYDSHPSAQAHGVAARAIAGRIRDAHLLPASP